MARPRASEKADYGLVYLQPIVALHKGTLKDADALEWLHGYGAALAAYRAGNFDSASIPCPSVFAWDEDAWQRHIEAFIDGVEQTERHRAKMRRKGVSYEETRQGAGVSYEETRQVKRSEGEVNGTQSEVNGTETKRTRTGARETPHDASPAFGRGGGYAACEEEQYNPPAGAPLAWKVPTILKPTVPMTPEAEANRHGELSRQLDALKASKRKAAGE